MIAFFMTNKPTKFKEVNVRNRNGQEFEIAKDLQLLHYRFGNYGCILLVDDTDGKAVLNENSLIHTETWNFDQINDFELSSEGKLRKYLDKLSKDWKQVYNIQDFLSKNPYETFQ